MPSKKTNPDFLLIIVTLALLATGLLMVFSASEIVAEYKFNDAFYF